MPPASATSSASITKDNTTAPSPNPRARMVAISRERSATAEYIVFSAANTAPRAITSATSEPSTVMNVVICCEARL
jgi:hypothetical protein